MFSSILLLMFVPWLDTSRVRSTKYRPVYKWFFWLFIISVVALGYLGSKPAEGTYVLLGACVHGLLLHPLAGRLPIVGVMETAKPLPNRSPKSVLGKRGGRCAEALPAPKG